MYHFEVYKDVRGFFRWRFWSSNGRIIADGGEGYSSAQGAVDGINIIAIHSSGAKISHNY